MPPARLVRPDSRRILYHPARPEVAPDGPFCAPPSRGDVERFHTDRTAGTRADARSVAAGHDRMSVSPLPPAAVVLCICPRRGAATRGQRIAASVGTVVAKTVQGGRRRQLTAEARSRRASVTRRLAAGVQQIDARRTLSRNSLTVCAGPANVVVTDPEVPASACRCRRQHFRAEAHHAADLNRRGPRAESGLLWEAAAFAVTAVCDLTLFGHASVLRICARRGDAEKLISSRFSLPARGYAWVLPVSPAVLRSHP